VVACFGKPCYADHKGPVITPGYYPWPERILSMNKQGLDYHSNNGFALPFIPRPRLPGYV
jgi:hypothetical protein